MTAQGLRAACRAHAVHSRNPGSLLQAVSADLWRASPGDQKAAAFCAILTPGSSTLTWASGGNVQVLLCRQNRRRTLFSPMPPLGAFTESQWRQHRHRLERGDFLVAMVGCPIPDCGGRPLDLARTSATESLSKFSDLAGLLEHLAEQWENALREAAGKGLPRPLPALLALRRTAS